MLQSTIFVAWLLGIFGFFALGLVIVQNSVPSQKNLYVPVPGIQGFQGVQGPTGEKGIPGLNGPQGLRGPTGNTGHTGSTAVFPSIVETLTVTNAVVASNVNPTGSIDASTIFSESFVAVTAGDPAGGVNNFSMYNDNAITWSLGMLGSIIDPNNPTDFFGTNFTINSFDNSGNYIASPVFIDRATRRVTFQTGIWCRGKGTTGSITAATPYPVGDANVQTGSVIALTVNSPSGTFAGGATVVSTGTGTFSVVNYAAGDTSTYDYMIFT